MAMRIEKTCVVCGAPLPPRRQRYCSEACSLAFERRRAKDEYKPTGRPSLYRDKICPDCGVSFVGHIKTKRCKSCQAEADRKHDRECKQRAALGKVRRLGSIDLCEICGKPYTVNGGKQRYCSTCAPIANRKIHNDFNRAYYSYPANAARKSASRLRDPMSYTCEVCGATFSSRAFSLTCSADCRAIHRKAYMSAYDADRSQQRIQYSRARWAALTPEQREEVNRQAREAYARRKSKPKEDAHP